MNRTMADFGRKKLKELLSQCTESQQLMFKRMYAHDNLDLPIGECVDQMDESKIDWAISQCERTVEKSNINP